MWRTLVSCCLSISMLEARATSTEPPRAANESVTPSQADFFERKIRPVLIDRCLDCHSGAEAESGLNLESRANMLLGGKLGAAVKPGIPKQSLLISAIKHDEFIKMPPKEKLPISQVVDFTKWVEMGAPWPNSNPAPIADQTRPDAEKQTIPEQIDHWAFRPVGNAQPPRVSATLQSPIDQFIVSRLDANQLRAAPPTDKRTLIRRATYDLTGLSPTPDEVSDFLTDDSPLAFTKVIDRLLGSPRYGERWGRHWLDVARYADSNGLDENLSYANAYRYRDFVISAFNADKPYGQFVEEQIAGDLISGGEDGQPSMERQIATGFLAIGPKMLAEDDPVKMQMDIIDEQISTLGQTFMALTIGCARCHDHKFDPFPTEDYYSLAGIFKSSKTMVNHKVVAVWYERPLVPQEVVDNAERIDQAIEQLNKSIEQLKGNEDTDSQQRLTDLEEKLEELEASRPEIPVAMGVTEGTPQDLRIHLRGSHIALGAVAPRRFPRFVAGGELPSIGDRQSGRLELARWLSNPNHPLVGRVLVNRVWHWRFGRGLTATVDNFGTLGEPPTHPLLLDWLTRTFLDGGGSIKQLHRTMLLSDTYQMSTQFNDVADRQDPENTLLWRNRRRRLTAEEMRDSLIELGVGLDFQMGGSLLKVKNRAYVTGSGTQVTSEYDTNRRSVYLPVVRSSVYEVLQAFDFPDPAVSAGRRQTSTVAPQALMMMNSDLVDQQTGALATRLLELPSFDRRVATAFERILTRPPEDNEVQAARAYLEQARRLLSKQEGDGQVEFRAWQSYCRVLLSSNEFAYIE